MHDGIDHINIYSKGKTELGRMLSNFANIAFRNEDGYFSSVEGYWYWLSVPESEPRRDELRLAHGFYAKMLGRELRGKDWIEDVVFKKKIIQAIKVKIALNRRLKKKFIESSLPFRHYYKFGERIVEPVEGRWILEALEEYRRELQQNKVSSYENQEANKEV